MKKTYVKPELYFENFELSSNIAAGCQWISTSAENVCPVTVDMDGFGKVQIFVKDSCKYYAPDLQDKVCYHSPQDNNNVFTS